MKIKYQFSISNFTLKINFGNLNMQVSNIYTDFVLGGDKGRTWIGSEEIMKNRTRVWKKYPPLNFFPDVPQLFLTIKKTQNKIKQTQKNPCSS